MRLLIILARTSVCVCVCVCVCVIVCMWDFVHAWVSYLCVCACVCLYHCVHVGLCAFMGLTSAVCVRARVCVCVNVCVRACVRSWGCVHQGLWVRAHLLDPRRSSFLHFMTHCKVSCARSKMAVHTAGGGDINHFFSILSFSLHSLTQPQATFEASP